MKNFRFTIPHNEGKAVNLLYDLCDKVNGVLKY